MTPEFNPKRSKNTSSLEPLPDLAQARKDDLLLAPNILRYFEFGNQDQVSAPSSVPPEKPKLRIGNAASHFRLRNVERALMRVEHDIASLERAHRLPSLIDKLEPTRMREISKSISAIAKPLIYGTAVGVLPLVFSRIISEGTLVRALGVFGGLCCAAVGLIGAAEKFKSERLNHATALHPSARIRSFLIDLQSDNRSMEIRRRAITAKIETLQQRSLKMARARSQIELKLVSADIRTI